MSIDDPIHAVEKRFEDEERASDPVITKIAALAAEFNFPWPANKAFAAISSRLARNRAERIQLVIEAIKDELRRQERGIAELKKSANDTRKHVEEWVDLVYDGLKKAEQTRAKERVKRIGTVLARALLKLPPPQPDDVEEMLRVAMELSDFEVLALKNLVTIQGSIVLKTGRADRYQAWESWSEGPWGSVPSSEIDSAFLKLESFGLVSGIAPPNNQNIYADIHRRYALLKKGLDFILFVESQ